MYFCAKKPWKETPETNKSDYLRQGGMGTGVGALLFTVYLLQYFDFMDHVLPIQKKIKKTYSIYF